MSVDVEFVTRTSRPWTSMLANTPSGRRWMADQFPTNPSPSRAIVLSSEVEAYVSKAKAAGLITVVWEAPRDPRQERLAA